jgi:hypothetical protein
MKHKNKTKKWRKNNRKRQTKKKYGGKSTDTVQKPEVSNLEANNPPASEGTKRTDAIMTKVKDEHKIDLPNLVPSMPSMPEVPEVPDLGDSNIIEKTGQLAEGVTVNAFENTGALLGVDLSNPKETSEKLDDIKEAITSPENMEKMTEIVGEAAKVGAVALDAAEPFTDPLLKKSGEVLEKSGSIIGKAGVNILLNTAEEIPGVGVVLGTVRSLSKIGEAGLAVVDATSEVVTTSSDSINATSKNFNELMQEKDDVLKRTDDSVKEFEEPLKKPVPSTDKVPTGGTSRRNEKKYKGKTKRVRFAL